MTDVLTYEGIGACTGEATGIARLPNDPLFKEGDILIASMTTPDNVPQMKLASGIITDQGSITCHASIVSRELGIPCMVSYIRHNAEELVGRIHKVEELNWREVELVVNGMNDAHCIFEESKYVSG